VIRGGIAAFVAVVLVWLIGGYFVIVSPKVNQPTHADAVVVLGSVHVNGRLQEGLELVNQGLADNLVLSVGPSDYQAMRGYACNGQDTDAKVICFTPDPSTTRGEAEEVHRLAEQNGWKKIIVVTSTFHVSRARYIFGRCFDGSIEMVGTSTGGISLGTWAYEYLYQTAGYLKAFAESGC
jgi:uncharacterized SAM-binding protein YcdF (DUF218 family)